MCSLFSLQITLQDIFGLFLTFSDASMVQMKEQASQMDRRKREDEDFDFDDFVLFQFLKKIPGILGAKFFTMFIMFLANSKLKW